MSINYKEITSAQVKTAPYKYVVIDNILKNDKKYDFPDIKSSGSHNIADVVCPDSFKDIIEEIKSNRFRENMENLLGIKLSQYEQVVTLRGKTSCKDGKPHVDSKSKVITILIYFNNEWNQEGGKLRILSSDNVEDFVEEIEPSLGKTLIFERSEKSWHGHLPFKGKRQSIQINWVKGKKSSYIHILKHRVSRWFKSS